MKAQQVLSLKIENETVVSRPFDFEAFCLINENHLRGMRGKPSLCKDALGYMFEGTKVTDAVLETVGIQILVGLCDTLWEFYMAAIPETPREQTEKN